MTRTLCRHGHRGADDVLAWLIVLPFVVLYAFAACVAALVMVAVRAGVDAWRRRRNPIAPAATRR